jgi:hypothetical protein
MKYGLQTGETRGQAYVELVVSVLVLAVLGFGAVDLSKSLSTSQRMSAVGREGGRVFIKNNFDTTNLSVTDLNSEVEDKVYDLLKQAMLPEDLDTQGGVIITVARRVNKGLLEGGSESVAGSPPEPDDQLKITHVFTFGNASLGIINTKIKDELSDTYIAGSIEPDPDFLPVGTVRRDEELVIVEMFYKNEFMTPIANLVPGLTLDLLYDRTVF